MGEQSSTEVYQLHVWLREISPMVWRRVLVRTDSTIADLHSTLQIAMGWSDDHLHRFVIHGKDYGISRIGGIGFSDDPHQVRLVDFGFRLQERFAYEYDFGAGWQRVIRVERRLPVDARRAYPVCIGGARACPLETCAGPWAYLELRQRYHPILVARRLAEVLGDVLDTAHPRCPRCRRALVDAHRDELTVLLHWARAERFDRRRVNRQLHQHAAGDDSWRWMVLGGAGIGVRVGQ
jgi:hypothetical protein